MRSGIAILFVILYIVALFRPAWPLIDYYANRDFFASVLCVNKDKPALHCNGKCALMQKFRLAVEEDTQESPVPKICFEDYPLGLSSSPEYSFYVRPAGRAVWVIAPDSCYTFLSAKFLLRPPQM